MDLKTLQTMVAIAETGSFVEASTAVNLSQSAVSLRVKALEDSLGVALFDRRSRPPVLNTEGMAFVTKARRILRDWEELSGEFRQSGRAKLSLGVVPTSLLGVVPPGLKLLQEQAPGLQIHLTSGLSDALLGMVMRHEIDCAIVTEFTDFPDEIAWHPLASERLVLIAPADLEANTAAEALRRAPYIRFKKHAWAGRLIEQEVNRQGIRLRVAMEVDTLDGIALLVSSGLGVAVVPSRPITNPFPESLHVFPFGTPPVARGIGLIERLEHPAANAIAKARDAFTQVARTIYRD